MRQLLQPAVSGRFLEIGVGSGNLYEDLVGWGCRGLCLDLNPALIREHRWRSSHLAGVVEFRNLDFFQVEGCFDLVLAFEVLEHYLDDRQCLDRWRELLAPDGTLLFSVPAHQRRWTSNDDRAGHARRYEKAELLRKLSQSGFAVEKFCCYGFPVLNWTYPLSSLLFPGRSVVAGPAGPDPDRPPTATGSMKDFRRTAGSGVRRFARLSQWLLKEWLWRPLLVTQRPFLPRDLGIGYMVKCRKTGSPGSVGRPDLFETKEKRVIHEGPVRRGKAPSSGGCESRPTTVAPVGSSQGGSWRQRNGLKHSGVKGRHGRLSDHAGRNASERRAGLETDNTEADPPGFRGRPLADGEESDAGTDLLPSG